MSLLLIITVKFKDQISAAAGGHQHQRHYAFGIDQWFLNTGAYATTKATSGAGQLSCGSGVEAEFVDDLNWQRIMVRAPVWSRR